MVLCHYCGENPATVMMKKITNGHKEEIHLCAECAKGEAGGLNLHLDPSFALQNLLTSLMDQGNLYSPLTANKYHQQVQCPQCGLSYEEFRKAGRFGCSSCYGKFKPYLAPFLQRIHGNSKHLGKVFSGHGQSTADLEISKLKKDLEKLIAEEEYEEAAKIRDRIRSLEQSGQSSGGREES